MQIRDDNYWILYRQGFNETELERIKIENKSLKEQIKDLKFIIENYKEILKK